MILTFESEDGLNIHNPLFQQLASSNIIQYATILITSRNLRNGENSRHSNLSSPLSRLVQDIPMSGSWLLPLISYLPMSACFSSFIFYLYYMFFVLWSYFEYPLFLSEYVDVNLAT